MPKLIRQFLCLATLIGVHGCAHVDEQWFYVTGASLQESGRHRDLSKAFATKDTQPLSYDDREFIVTGHRIKAGDGTILALRSFAPGPLLGVDQASFLKVTSYIPRTKLLPGVEIRVPDADGTIAYLSTSSSNLPGETGCFGYASQGSIKVNSVSESDVAVTIDLQFRLASPLGFSGECGDRRVQGTYVVPRLQLQQLNPWQGIVGKTLYEETIAP